MTGGFGLAGGGGGGESGTLMYAPPTWIEVLASAVSALVKTEPWPLIVGTEDVPTA